MMLKRMLGLVILMCLSTTVAEARETPLHLRVQQSVNASVSHPLSQPAQPLDPHRQTGLIIAIGLAGGLTWLRSQSEYSI